MPWNETQASGRIPRLRQLRAVARRRSFPCRQAHAADRPQPANDSRRTPPADTVYSVADDMPVSPADVRSAAEALKAAIDTHLAAVENRSGENDPRVQQAYDALAAAAETYDDLLFSAYEEVTPFGPSDVDEDDDEDDVDEDDAGFDDDLEWEPDSR